MFPGIRQPEVSYDFSTPKSDNKDTGKKEEDESILSKYGGKIALAAFSIAGALLWGYFKGSKNKSDVEDRILDCEPLEPYEVHELRYSNKHVTRAKMESIMDSCAAYCRSHPEGYTHSSVSRPGDFIMPYTDFISLCNIVMCGDDKTEKYALSSGYLFDRVVMRRAVRPLSDSPSPTSSTNTDLNTAMLSLPLALVLLSVVCQGHIDDRLTVLFNIGRRFGRSNVENSSPILSSDGATTTDVICYDDFSLLLQELMMTCQIPSEKRVIFSEDTVAYKIKQAEPMTIATVASFPFRFLVGYFKPKEYFEKNAMEMAHGAFEHEAKKKTLDMTGIELVKDSDIVAKKPNNSTISFPNFKVLMRGYSVCAWGECYRYSDE